MSKTFCPIPWIFQAVRNNGDIRVCCQANVTKNKGVIRKQDGTPYNAAHDSIDDARNAPLMLSIRNNMLNGIWSDECGRCRVEEESGLNSRRQYELENWNFKLKDAIEITSNDGFVSRLPVRYYDLRFGNLCNLACRMCGPTDSHTWYEQWLGYYGSDSYNDTHGKVTLLKNENNRLYTHDYDWHSSETFWNNIEKNIPNIEHVYMAGGEPMMIERHYEFLQKCIDMDCAKNIIIEYNTNMSNLPSRVLKMWTYFKQVRVGASIDGMGAVVEYQRWPLKWSQAYKNLQKLDNLCMENNNIMSWLAVTVTSYNVWHFPEFMYWKLKESGFKKINSTKKHPIVTHHVAHHPQHLNIRILPKNLKNDLETYYKQWIDKFNNDAQLSNEEKVSAYKILSGIIKYATSEDWSLHMPEFIRYTKYLDKERNQSILSIVPQYKELFNE